MPPRSVVLNVSITARGMGKSDVVESVREVNEVGAAQRDLEKERGMGEVNMHDRVDSATSVSPLSPQPSLTDIASAAVSPTTTINIIPATTEVPALWIPTCATCNATTKPNGSSLARCKACATVHYCSTDCQRLDWPTHKRNCTFRSHSSRSVSRTSSVPPSPQPASPMATLPTVAMADAGIDAIQGKKVEEVTRKDSVQEEEGKMSGEAMDLDA